jgi:hypothetical protein
VRGLVLCCDVHELLLTIIISVMPKGKPAVAYVSLNITVHLRQEELTKIRNLKEGGPQRFPRPARPR